MRKTYLFSGISILVAMVFLTVLLVSADNPTTPFDYMVGDDDDADFTSSIQVASDYSGNFSEFEIIEQSEAELIALNYTTGGEAKEAELEAENGNVVWEIEVLYDGNTFDIVIDAGNGEVLGAFYDKEGLDFDLFDD